MTYAAAETSSLIMAWENLLPLHHAFSHSARTLTARDWRWCEVCVTWRVGIAPLYTSGKDAISMFSNNSFMIAIGVETSRDRGKTKRGNWEGD